MVLTDFILTASINVSRDHMTNANIQEENFPYRFGGGGRGRGKEEKPKGRNEGRNHASVLLLLIHSPSFNHSDAVTSSAPGSPYMHERKAIPFRRL